MTALVRRAPFSAWTALLVDLGHDYVEVQSVAIDDRGVVVTEYLLDEAGERVAAGDGAATQTVVHPWDRSS